MLGIAGEISTNSSAMFSNGLLCMDIPELADQQKNLQLRADVWYHLEGLPKVMTDRDWWQVSIKGIHAVYRTWWNLQCTLYNVKKSYDCYSSYGDWSSSFSAPPPKKNLRTFALNYQSIEALYIRLEILGFKFIGYSRCPRGAMAKVMDYGIVVSEFVLQSCYYVHFRVNTLRKVWTPLSFQLWVK